MKQFFFLLFIAGAAAGGWWFARASGTPANGDANQSTEIPGPGGETAPNAGDVPGPAGVPGPGTNAGDPPRPANGVPAAVQTDFAQAEAMWAAAAAQTPDDPARNGTAPDMARRYSAILRATYADPTATGFAERLVAERLTPLGTALFFTSARYDDGLFQMYTVNSGDVPDRIAKQFGMSYHHLNRLRGRGPQDSNLRVGENLKVIKLKEAGGSYLHVSKSGFILDAFIGGVFARRYKISIGAVETPTPVGKTVVTDLVYDPPWTPPGQSVTYAPGDPNNILGGVWIALASEGIQKSGIGLHGYTGEDQTLQKKASNGCLRLANDEIKELAGLIAGPQRSPCTVEIVE